MPAFSNQVVFVAPCPHRDPSTDPDFPSGERQEDGYVSQVWPSSHTLRGGPSSPWEDVHRPLPLALHPTVPPPQPRVPQPARGLHCPSCCHPAMSSFPRLCCPHLLAGGPSWLTNSGSGIFFFLAGKGRPSCGLPRQPQGLLAQRPEGAARPSHLKNQLVTH